MSAAEAYRLTRRSLYRSDTPGPSTGSTFSRPPPALCGHRGRNSGSRGCWPSKLAVPSPPGQQCALTDLADCGEVRLRLHQLQRDVEPQDVDSLLADEPQDRFRCLRQDEVPNRDCIQVGRMYLANGSRHPLM